MKIRHVSGTVVIHACELQPDFRENIIAGPMFTSIPLDMDSIFSIIIVMPGASACGEKEAGGPAARSF